MNFPKLVLVNKLFYSTIFLSFIFLSSCGDNKKHGHTILRLSHGLDESHPVHKSIVFFGHELAKKSQGMIEVQIFPNAQLGPEEENLEMLRTGKLDMAKVSAANLEYYSDKFKVFSLPYLFRDSAQEEQVLTGDIGKEILMSTEDHNMIGLCYYEAGTRNFYSLTKPIHTPDDLKGMKVRTQTNKLSMEVIRLLGAEPVPIKWTDVYAALHNGEVDAAENNLPSFFTAHHYEMCKFYTKDEHSAVPDVLLINGEVWNSFAEEEKKWIKESAMASQVFQIELWRKKEREVQLSLKQVDVQIIYPDKKLFKDKTQPIYDSFKNQPKVYDLVNRINALK